MAGDQGQSKDNRRTGKGQWLHRLFGRTKRATSESPVRERDSNSKSGGKFLMGRKNENVKARQAPKRNPSTRKATVARKKAVLTGTPGFDYDPKDHPNYQEDLPHTFLQSANPRQGQDH